MTDAQQRDAWPGSFWRSRRVLVTGHTGFKGPWLCRALLRAGAQVMGYSLPPPTTPSLFELLGLEQEIDHRHGDVRDVAGLQHAVESFGPEIVVHMAAQSLVLESYRDPVATFSTNTMGTVNVLEAVRSRPEVRACVVVTSDKCYEADPSGRAHTESDPMGGVDPYSASKGCAELVTAAYRRALFRDGSTRIVSARAGNVIGGGDWSADRLIPDIVRALTTNSTLVLRHPDAVRPWQHVLEPISGYLDLVERVVDDPLHEGGWNFGPRSERAWPVSEIVSEFNAAWGGQGGESITTVRSEYPETAHLALDSTKARERLGWSPRWDVGVAIERTVQWYRALYREGAEAVALVDADIDAYASAGVA
jgi:CDP-glucose 4,6-dehydratase